MIVQHGKKVRCSILEFPFREMLVKLGVSHSKNQLMDEDSMRTGLAVKFL